MADIKLFHLQTGAVRELPAESSAIEKSLQTLLEQHLDAFLGVRLVATEYPTGKKHGGRIDTLGLDDNNCPVIIEYKRALNENVINQGLFYLDWLMDHKADFELLVMRRFDSESIQVEWSAPRLLCIAADFTKYDEYAVQQIERNIELLRYRRYGADLLLLELVNASSAESAKKHGPSDASKERHQLKPSELSGVVQDLWESLKAFLLALGDDVQMRELEKYIAFRRLKNFACVQVRKHDVLIWAKLDPCSVEEEPGFTRNVGHLGHAGTGDLEIRVQNAASLEKAERLLERAYKEN